MLEVAVLTDCVRVGERLSISFQRTLRVPEDGHEYPLPPGLGPLPVLDAEPHLQRLGIEPACPAVLVPLRRREAVWLAFRGAPWKPNAVKVGVGAVNAVSGRPLDDRLHDDPQDYVVCPGQPWLDGIAVGSGRVRQFVAVPLGTGDSVEAQLTGREVGGIHLMVFEPVPGRFPDQAPSRPPAPPGQARAAAGGMGLGAGGSIRQRVHPDPYGLSAWDQGQKGQVRVILLDAERYREVTGRPSPPTPVDARTYTEHGLPWFELYDERAGALDGSDLLAAARTVRERAVERGDPEPGDDDDTVDVEPAQIHRLTEDR